MKNHTTFVRMRSGDHLGDTKMSKRGTSLHRSYVFRIALDKNGFCRHKENGQTNKIFASDLLVFAPRLSYDFSKLSDNFIPFVQL